MKDSRADGVVPNGVDSSQCPARRTASVVDTPRAHVRRREQRPELRRISVRKARTLDLAREKRHDFASAAADQIEPVPDDDRGAGDLARPRLAPCRTKRPQGRSDRRARRPLPLLQVPEDFAPGFDSEPPRARHARHRSGRDRTRENRTSRSMLRRDPERPRESAREWPQATAPCVRERRPPLQAAFGAIALIAPFTGTSAWASENAVTGIVLGWAIEYVQADPIPCGYRTWVR